MPAALALPEISALMFWVALILIVYVLAQTYFQAQQLKGTAVNWPLVGQSVVDAINFGVDRLRDAGGVVDNLFNRFALDAIRGMGRLFVLVARLQLASTFQTIAFLGSEATQAAASIRHLFTVELPAIRAAAGVLAAQVAHLANVVVAQLAAQLAALESKVVDDLLPRLVAVEQQVAVLIPFLGILQRLAAFELATGSSLAQEAAQLGRVGGAVGQLEGDLAQAWGRIGQLEKALTEQQAMLARLTALLVLAGVGAVAIENLVRLARDPCYCLTDGGFSDLPGRVASLEGISN